MFLRTILFVIELLILSNFGLFLFVIQKDTLSLTKYQNHLFQWFGDKMKVLNSFLQTIFSLVIYSRDQQN